MPQITLNNVTIAYTGHALLDGVTCHIEPGQHIGLLGRNGCGKTTLMRMVAGMEQPDHGSVDLYPGTRVALLPQDVPEGISGDVHSIVASGVHELAAKHESEWEEEQRIERTLRDMQLDGTADFQSLSTGMKRRVLLAKAIAGEADVLLLDEPTNHLDVSSIVWLEDFLARWRGTLLFVTHDRAFLTKLAERILEIDRGKIFDWSCDYPTFLVRKEEALAAEEKQNALFDKKLAQEEVWIRQGIKARRTRNEGRVRALQELRRIRSQRRDVVGNVQLDIDDGERSGALVLKTEGASFGYGDRVIIRDLTTSIMRGDKVGIIGPNGAGKSTLLKGLLGQLAPLDGSVRQGTNLQIAYFDQTRDQLDPNQTAEDNVGEGKSSITIAGKTKHIIGYLQDFLFTSEQARQPIRFFSGGQRNRLLLAKLFAKPANLLVMDEPTNDLDSETLELLEQRLVGYEGTVLMVSHDRAFLNNVVGSTLAFEGDTLREYVGGYDDWLRQSRASASREVTAAAQSTAKSAASPSAAPTAAVAGGEKKKLNFKDQRELEQLPGKIEKLEAKLAKIHEEMAKPEFFKQAGATLAVKQTEERAASTELTAAYARWEELEALRG
ncbi:ATP-binding cassette domain-containing protein [Lacipirellula parvula]|uniref:ATP-binding protein Uup n=1 Tax=Lacipirellula parvula TaxID=2650471 RepID=A0A5K7X9K1_9BACT|nr:ATP-binding cassette domain-containing protein [Lacipirellula parvula]BBO32532.1 bis-ABC ATPase Uup [Lacipirellula parvula]